MNRLDMPLTIEDQRIMSRTNLTARMEYMVGDARDAAIMEKLERRTTGCPACDVRMSRRNP